MSRKSATEIAPAAALVHAKQGNTATEAALAEGRVAVVVAEVVEVEAETEAALAVAVAVAAEATAPERGATEVVEVLVGEVAGRLRRNAISVAAAAIIISEAAVAVVASRRVDHHHRGGKDYYLLNLRFRFLTYLFIINRSRSRSPSFGERARRGGGGGGGSRRLSATAVKCLGVFGISVFTQADDLHRIFARYGRVRDVQLVMDRFSRRSRGFGFVYFERQRDADEVSEGLPFLLLLVGVD